MNMLKKLNKLFANNIIFGAVIFLAAISIYTSVMPVKKAKAENAEVKKELKTTTQEYKNKEKELELLNDKGTKDDVAREAYKISEKDELLFVFPEE